MTDGVFQIAQKRNSWIRRKPVGILHVSEAWAEEQRSRRPLRLERTALLHHVSMVPSASTVARVAIDLAVMSLGLHSLLPHEE